MDNINQIYDALLKKQFYLLNEEVAEQGSKFALEMSDGNAVSSSAFIMGHLKIEIQNIRAFSDYAISEFKRLANSPIANKDELEQTYHRWIETFYDSSSERMRSIMESPLMPRLGLEETVMNDLLKVKSQTMDDIRAAKAELTLGLSKATTSPILIQNSAVGVINLGSITGDISHNIVALQNSGHNEIANAIQELLKGINEFKEEIGENHTEIMNLLQFLTEEVNKPAEQRNLAVMKRVFRSIPDLISMSSGLVTIWDKCGPQIAGFLGLNP